MVNLITDLIRDSKIDFTNAIISLDDFVHNSWDIDFFEISPQKYLNNAKNDFKISDDRGKINAISNAKRAIDCQIENIIKCLQLDIRNQHLKNFCDFFVNDKKSLSFNLRLIRAFNIAPIFLISNIRELRNKVEHEYSIPTKEDTISAIELAELFINSITNKYKEIRCFEITDEKRKLASPKGYITGIYFDVFDKGIRVRLDENELIINNIDNNYPVIIAMMISVCQDDDYFLEYLKYFLKINEHPIPNDKIKIKVCD